MKKRRTRIRQPEEILEVLERYRQSGQTQAAFSKRSGVPISTLQYWLKKEREGRLGRQSHCGEPAAVAQQLVPVKIVEPAPAREALLEFELARGGSLRFSTDLSPEELARYAEALGHRC